MPDLWTIAIRFIPAGAGNFATGFMQAAQKSVYPRWRGNSNSYTDKSSKQTVHPRWRGTRSTITSKSADPEFIPAGAGNSAPSLPYIARISVYPRWRGELISLLEYMSCAHGLFPALARELRDTLAEQLSHHGLSPLARGTLFPAPALLLY